MKYPDFRLTFVSSLLIVFGILTAPVQAVMSEKDKAALMSAYLKGHDANWTNDHSWGAQLAYLERSVRPGGKVQPEDFAHLAALTLFRLAYLDGRRSSLTSMYDVNYSRDRVKQLAPMWKQDAEADLPHRAEQIWYPMMRQTLLDHGYKEPFNIKNFPFELHEGYLSAIWEEIKASPEDAVLSAIQAPKFASDNDILSAMNAAVAGLDLVSRPFGSGTRRCDSSQNLASLTTYSPKEMQVLHPETCKEAIKAHAKYRKSSKQTPERAFTMFKDGKYVTYLPERHWENGETVADDAKNLVNAILTSKAPVFIETSDRYIGRSDADLSLQDYWLAGKTKPHDGIIGTLLKTDHVDYSLLKELEFGKKPPALARFDEQFKHHKESAETALKGAEADQALNESLRMASTERSLVQANTIDQSAPSGHSWAIGGSFHAKEVKEELVRRGWIEVEPTWVKQ